MVRPDCQTTSKHDPPPSRGLQPTPPSPTRFNSKVSWGPRLAFVVASVLAPSGMAAGELRGSTSRPASQPTSQPSTRERVEELVRMLGARAFQTREAAQRELTELGDDAAEYLIPFVSDPNNEIASRVAAALATPRDPALRVELAIRLLTTTDPDWMERGVYVLFASPGDVCDLFVERTRKAKGLSRVVLEPVREQLLEWKRMDEVFRRNYERIRLMSEEKAEALRKNNEDSRLYHAEAAYWGAHDALLDEQESRPEPTASGPADETRR